MKRYALVALVTLGCHASKPSPRPVQPEVVGLTLRAGANLNSIEAPSTCTCADAEREADCGRPAYYAVRKLAKISSFAEGYDDAFARVFAPERDPEITSQGLLAPCHTQRLVLPKDAKARYALYVFFAANVSEWKTLLPAPDRYLLVEVGAAEVALSGARP